MLSFAMRGDAIAVALRTALAIFGALVVGGLTLAIAGLNPVSALADILDAAVGSSFAINGSLLEALPITLTALGVALAYRAGLFNLGGQGQIYLGALAAVLVALWGKALPSVLLLPAVVIAGLVGGALCGAAAGWMRSRLGLSEIITTIMLNFIAFWLVSYLVRGPIQDPSGAGYPQTATIVPGAQIGNFGEAIPAGVVILIAATAVVWFLLERTRLGSELKDVGENEAAARFAGVRIGSRLFFALSAAGALGGLGGATELVGNQHRMSDFFSPNWGFDAIAVALIGRGSALGTLAAGLFFAALRSGVDGSQASAGVPISVSQVIQGVAVLFLVMANGDLIVNAMRRRSARRRERRLRERTA